MIKYFEDIFGEYEEVPPYLQCSLLHNLSYRMKDNILFPYHYSEEEFAHALDRISALLAKVDEVVLYNPFPMDDYHRTYFLSLKKNRTATFEYNPDEQLLKKGDTVLMIRNNVTFVVRRFYFNGNSIRFIAYIITPFFYF